MHDHKLEVRHTATDVILMQLTSEYFLEDFVEVVLNLLIDFFQVLGVLVFKVSLSEQKVWQGDQISQE